MRCLTLTSSASCFYHSAFVHMLKHKFSELIPIVAAFLALTDLSPVLRWNESYPVPAY